MNCPNCKKDITKSEATSDSEVNGFIDTSYECEDCEITVYTFKLEKGNSE